MTLHDMIQADASSVFCNVNDFAEQITYYARLATSREIYAVVVREFPRSKERGLIEVKRSDMPSERA